MTEQFDPNQHKELARSLINIAKACSLDDKHPAVQKAMIELHQKICNVMPNATDTERAHAIIQRAPTVAQNLNNMLPVKHLAGGGSSSDTNFDPDALKKLLAEQDKIKSTPILDQHVPTVTNNVMPGMGGSAITNGAMAGKMVGGPTGAVIGAVGGAAYEAAKAANLPIANGVANFASGHVDTGKTNQSQSLNAADKNVASQNNPDIREKNTSDDKKVDETRSNPTREEIDEMAKFDPEGAANLEAQTAQTGGVMPASAPNPGNQGIYSAPVSNPESDSSATQNSPQAPTSPATPTPEEADIAPPVTSEAKPSAFKNSQQMAIDASTPVKGATQARQDNLDRAQRYASSQTPEAMAAAQKDKGAILAGQLAGSGQDSAGRNSALSALANLGQTNLEGQQAYGNNSLQEANKTGLDTQANQGASIANANAASAQPRAAANNVTDVQKRNTNDAIMFDQVQKAVAAAKTLPSDISQAIWSGNQTAQEILSQGSMKNATPAQKTAVEALITLVHNYNSTHPGQSLTPPSGTIDAGSIKTMIDAAQAQNTNELNTARTKGQTAAGIDTSDAQESNGIAPNVSRTLNQGELKDLNPQGLADGGEVDPKIDIDEADLPDTDETPSTPQDTLRKAFGFKPKPSMVEDEQQAEDTAGPKTVTIAEEKVEATKQPESDIHAVLPAGEPEMPKNGDIGNLVSQAATSRNIDPRDLHAIIQTESGGNANAINRNKNGTSDHGLMQINDSNLKPGEEKMANDPEFNVNRGADIYREALDRFNGNKDMALYAYNHGIRAAERDGLGIAQRDPYVNKVKANMPQDQ